MMDVKKSRQRMKVLLIAPYIGLIRSFEEVVYRRDGIKLEAYECDTVDAPQLVKSLNMDNYDVIISRGYTCDMISQASGRYVLNVGISIYDALRTLQLAHSYQGKTAIVGFGGVVQHASALKSLLKYNIDIVTLKSIEEIKDKLLRLKKQGYTMVIGDVITTVYAKQVGLQNILITTGTESINAILDTAEQIYTSQTISRKKEKLYKRILDNVNNDVTVYNAEGEIIYTNETITSKIDRVMRHMIPPVLENETLTSVKGIEDQRYIFTGTVMTSDNEIYIVFSYRQITKKKSDSDFLQFKNPDETQPLSQRMFFSQTPSVKNILDTLKAFQFMFRPVIISGPKGSGKDQFSYYLYQEARQKKMPMAIINCKYATKPEWKELVNDDLNSPLLSNHYVLYFRDLHLLSESQQTDLITLIHHSNLHHRNQLIFSYVPEENDKFESSELWNELTCVLQSYFVKIPPLSERKEDIPNFATLYLNEFETQLSNQVFGFDPEAIEVLTDYSWPGNMYQMRLVIQELILRASSFNITADEVRQAIKNYETQFLRKENENEKVSLDGSLEDIVRRIIKIILQEEQGNQSKTARRLGISRTTLRRHLE